MFDVQKLTDDELKNLTDDLLKAKGPISRWWAKKKMEGRTKLNDTATQEITSAFFQEVTRNAVDDYRERRLQEKTDQLAHNETRSLQEQVNQAELKDRLEEIEFRKTVRAINMKLMEQAAAVGVDVPTLMEIVKAKVLGQSQNTELASDIANIMEAIKLDALQGHIELDMLRQGLAGMYQKEMLLKAQPDSSAKQKELKDLRAHIKTAQEDFNERQDRLVEKTDRKDSRRPKNAEPADPDLRTGTQDDNEPE